MPKYYKPEFDGVVKGWTINYSKANHWKVKRSVPWDDLMQEAYVVFLRCKRKYTPIDTGQHFLALYRTMWKNHMIDLAHEDSAQRIFVQDEEDGPDTYRILPEAIGELDHNGDLAIMLRQAPQEIIMVLNLFLNAPSELLELALAGWHGKDRRSRHGGSKRINKLLGLPVEVDILTQIEEYFSPSKS